MLKTNNPDLKVLNLNNHKEINDANLLEVIKALSNNTTIKVFALANTNMRDIAALVSSCSSVIYQLKWITINYLSSTITR